VKAAGFDAMLSLLAVVAALTLLAGMGLPGRAGSNLAAAAAR
jgi:hypothetical protein